MNPNNVFQESAEGFGFFGTDPIAQQSGSIRKALKAHNMIADIVPMHGEIYLNGNTTATAIDTAAQPHGLAVGATGLVSGFTFKAGTVGDIASVADNEDGTVTVTSTAHGLVTGDIVTINNSTDYDGVYVVTKVDDDTFKITVTYTETRTGTFQRAACLIADVNTFGIFEVNYVATVLSAGNYKELLFLLYQNITPNTRSVAQKEFGMAGTADEHEQLVGKCLMNISAGDIIWLAVQNLTDNVDFTVRHMNLSLVE